MTTLLSALASMAFVALVFQQSRLQAVRIRAGQAERLAAARGECLSLAASELKGIAATMAACRREALGPADHAPAPCDSAAGGLEGPVQQLLQLAGDLSEASCLGHLPCVEEAEIPLAPIINAAIDRVTQKMLPGRRYWKVDPALRALKVKADPLALEGALVALLHRAASHSRDGDLVALRWVVASETVAIVVEDEGDGLSLDDPAEGAGPPAGMRSLDLGLSLARGLAAAHGGDIRLESTPGIGARAWLTLPRTRLLEAA